MSSLSDADRFFSRIGPLYTGPNDIEEFRREPVKFHDKRKVAAVIYTNCNSKSGREDFVKTLMRQFPVHSSGPCMNNYKEPDIRIGNPTIPEGWRNSESFNRKMEIIEKYMFTIAYQNVVAPDYVDEKIWQALRVGSIPIYLGATNVDEFVPTGSYILVSDYASVDELVAHLLEVSENEELYNSYMAWKKKPFEQKFIRQFEHSIENLPDYLCQILTTRMGGR